MREHVELTAKDGIAAAVAGVIAGSAWSHGALAGVIVVWLMFGLVTRIAYRLYLAIRRRLPLTFVRRPWARDHRAYAWQCILGWAFTYTLVRVCEAAIIPEQFPGQYTGMMRTITACALGHACLEVLPTGKVRIGTNALRLFVALACGIQLVMLARTPTREEAAILEVPLSGDVVVIQGGPSPLVNHHYFASGQRDAVDLGVAENGTFRRPDGTGLDAVPCFGAPVLAPAAGTVVTASDGLPDAPVGQADTAHVAGNHLVIDLGASRFLVMAHLRQGSARVRPGDRVEPGTIVAACGNSGNTSEPHLHIQVQDRPTFPSEARTIPLLFRSRRANGEVLVAPRRADHLRSSDLPAPGP